MSALSAQLDIDIEVQVGWLLHEGGREHPNTYQSHIHRTMGHAHESCPVLVMTTFPPSARFRLHVWANS